MKPLFQKHAAYSCRSCDKIKLYGNKYCRFCKWYQPFDTHNDYPDLRELHGDEFFQAIHQIEYQENEPL